MFDDESASGGKNVCFSKHFIMMLCLLCVCVGGAKVKYPVLEKNAPSDQTGQMKCEICGSLHSSLCLSSTFCQNMHVL